MELCARVDLEEMTSNVDICYQFRILRNLKIDIKDIFGTKFKHLIEDQFEYRNTNSFKLSVCLFFYLGKLYKGSQSTI